MSSFVCLSPCTGAFGELSLARKLRAITDLKPKKLDLLDPVSDLGFKTDPAAMGLSDRMADHNRRAVLWDFHLSCRSRLWWVWRALFGPVPVKDDSVHSMDASRHSICGDSKAQLLGKAYSSSFYGTFYHNPEYTVIEQKVGVSSQLAA